MVFGVIKTILMPIIPIGIIWYLFRFKFICWFLSFFNFIYCLVHFIFSFTFLKAFCHIFEEVLNMIKYLSSQCMISLSRSFINLYLCVTPHTDPCGTHRWPAKRKLIVILLHICFQSLTRYWSFWGHFCLYPVSLLLREPLVRRFHLLETQLNYINQIFLHLHACWFLGQPSVLLIVNSFKGLYCFCEE